MITEEISWSREKTDFKGRKWTPETAPIGVLCIVHGHGEHCGRYAHVAQWFGARGYASIALDLRGHGKSGGKRGHTPSYDHFMDDLALFMEQAELAFPGLPKFLYGHSMGGNLVSNFLMRRKPAVKGAILTGSWFRLAFKPSFFKVMLGRMMNSIFPGLSQHTKLNAAHLSRDRDVVTAYETDPLVHDMMSARLFVCASDAGEWALDHAAELNAPVIVMHGEADEITSAEGSKLFAGAAKNASPQLNLFRGFFHEIHNEPEKEEVFKVIEAWLKMRV